MSREAVVTYPTSAFHKGVQGIYCSSTLSLPGTMRVLGTCFWTPVQPDRDQLCIHTLDMTPFSRPDTSSMSEELPTLHEIGNPPFHPKPHLKNT